MAMAMASVKKAKMEEEMVLERIPNTILMEILSKLELQSLCSIACVNKSLLFAVSETLPLLPTLHLSLAFSPDSNTLMNGILAQWCRCIKTLTLNCLRLDDSSLIGFLGPHLLELNLFCCHLISYQFLHAIGRSCPNLRHSGRSWLAGVLVLDLAAQDSSAGFYMNLAEILTSCLFLDSISLKIRGANAETSSFFAIDEFLPKTTRTLKLKSLRCQDAISMVYKLSDSGNSLFTTHSKNPGSLLSQGLMLQCLSLTLDVIHDDLIMAIAKSLPLLVELHLEDMSNQELLPRDDLTNRGLHLLGTCHSLIALSLIRGRHNRQVTFKNINDMGMFLLSEGCKGLQSVRFCGFSKVSDAGFASILHSCNRLQKFEVRNALLLSDLAFHDVVGVECFLKELRLLSCSLITSESVNQLAFSMHLEVLDLCGCKSVSDSCLGSISSLPHLSSLNLTATDVTDYGLSILGQGSPPIGRLCLRSCKRVTDEGIFRLFHGSSTIGKTLSALDLGQIPGISDRTIRLIASEGMGITELCIRSCFHVTDSSVEALAMKKRFQDESKFLISLDLFNCIGLSVDSCRSFRGPLFPGLQWLGIGNTTLSRKGDAVLTDICSKRPWLTLCFDGCEVGCHDAWHFHSHR